MTINAIVHTIDSRHRLIQFQSGPMKNLQYALIDSEKKEMVAFDPAWSIAPILDVAAEWGVSITQIWVTHGHYDHVNQLNNLVNALQKTPLITLHATPLFVPESPNIRAVTEGTQIEFGTLKWQILHTPGHSPDSVCFYTPQHLICGDLLFVDACGRSDLPGSNPNEMKKSLERISQLPADTIIYPGHDYGPTLTDTIQNQLETNPHLAGAHYRTARIKSTH